MYHVRTVRAPVSDSELLESVVAPILARCRSGCTPLEFHRLVNVTFHNYESEVYDQVHCSMWESVPEQFGLLLEDCPELKHSSSKLKVLDIGCGTGLASFCIIQSVLAGRIDCIHLADTSPAMLARAADLVNRAGIRTEVFEGPFEDFFSREKYDILIAGAVLHHIPDLPLFFSKLHTLQKPDGFFFHVHDANADFSNDPVLKRRMSDVSGRPPPKWIARFTPNRVWGRVCRELKGTQGQDPHSKTNRDLLRGGHIRVPLTVPEIHRITDVQLHSRQGVSIEQMKRCLLKYELLCTRSYGFFGRLGSSLPVRLRQEERRLISNRAPNGLYIAGAWRRGA